VDASDKTRPALLKLQSIGGTIHAIVYRGGSLIGDRKLDDGTKVLLASAADMADAPKKVPRLTGDNEERIALGFTGWYVLPGEGLAAIFGAKPPEK
jgi:hypothetical protein